MCSIDKYFKVHIESIMAWTYNVEVLKMFWYCKAKSVNGHGILSLLRRGNEAFPTRTP